MKDFIAYLKFDTLNEEEILNYCKDKIDHNERCITVTPNLDNLRITYKNVVLRSLINNKANISTIDGVPVKWIAKILGKKQFKKKISGSDLALEVIKMAADNNYSLLFFGGAPGVGEKAKANLLLKYPNLKIDLICPEFGHEKDPELSKKYCDLINQYNADIIFLCTGYPKSELFFVSNENSFKRGCYFFVGATIDFIAGSVKRAPKWMSKCGLEWLYRLFHDFRRLFKRYWLDFWFLLKIFFLCIFNRKKFDKLIKEAEESL